MLGEHIGPRMQAHDEEGAEQDRHRAAARHAERDRGYEVPALLRVIRRTGTEHAAYIAGAEAPRSAAFLALCAACA